MRIALIIDDYLPESQKSGAQLMHDLACYLVGKGHNVSVITPMSSLKQRYTKECLDSVTIYRFQSGQIKNITKIVRAVNETLLSLRAIRNLKTVLRDSPHDLVVYYSPSIFWGGFVLYLKWIWKCRSYLILRDIFPQWAIDGGLVSRWSPICWYFKLFEYISYRVADRIGVQTPGNMEYFQKYSTKVRSRLEVLYNWARERKKDYQPGVWREQLNLQGKVIFFFGGNLGHAQDMMNIIRLAANLNDRSEAHFLLVGKGDEVPLIENEIKAQGLANVTFHPSVPAETYFQMLSETDIGLFSLHREHNTQNVPGKLLGYMDYELPILGSINPGNDVQISIKKHEAGLVTVNGDDKGFAKNALRLLEDVQYRKRLGKNGKRLLQEIFSVEQAAKQIINI